MKSLDSGFRRNDEKRGFSTFYEAVKIKALDPGSRPASQDLAGMTTRRREGIKPSPTLKLLFGLGFGQGCAVKSDDTGDRLDEGLAQAIGV